MQLGRFGLALERAQPAARLALDVQRAVEVLLCALELQLRAATALAVLAEPGGLLDQHPSIAWLGGHDRLDAALGDDRMGLLAEPRVGEDLDHVRQAAAGAVEAIATVAVAVEAAHDRDLAQRQIDACRRSSRARSPPRPPSAAARRGRRRRSRPASTARAPLAATARPSPIAPRRSRSTCPSRSDRRPRSRPGRSPAGCGPETT